MPWLAPKHIPASHLKSYSNQKVPKYCSYITNHFSSSALDPPRLSHFNLKSHFFLLSTTVIAANQLHHLFKLLSVCVRACAAVRPQQTRPVDRNWGASRAAPLTRSDVCSLPQRPTHVAVSGMRSVPSIKDVYCLRTVAPHARPPVRQRARTTMWVSGSMLWC